MNPHQRATIFIAWLKFFVTFLSPCALILAQCQENWCSHHSVPFSIPICMHITTSRTFDITSETSILRDFRLPPPCSRDLRSSGMLHCAGWQLVTEVSGQPIGSIFRTGSKGYRLTSQKSEGLLLSSWKYSWIFRWSRNPTTIFTKSHQVVLHFQFG
jgi:hypothetical protein